VAPSNKRAKLLATLLASTFSLQGSLAALAEGSSAVGAASIFSKATNETASTDSLAPKELSSMVKVPGYEAKKATEAAPAPTEMKAQQLAWASPILPYTTDESAAQVIGDAPIFSKKTPVMATITDAGQPSSTVLSAGASMTADEAMGKIDDLTRQILLKEIEVERFNLHYSIEVAKQGRWKGWRYAACQEANAGMGLGGGIISVAYRGARLHNPGAVRPCIQEAANYVPMIGNIIGASAAALEFGINEYHEIQAGNKGFGPGESLKKIASLKGDIDRLMVERESLLRVEITSSALTGHVEIDSTEGKVLRDLRDQELQEFQRFHVGARKLLAFQQMQYFFDLAKYTTNAIGYDFAYLSLHRQHRVWNGRAGVLFAVSGGLTMFAPIISRGVGKAVGEINHSKTQDVIRDSNGAKVETLQADLSSLNHLFVATNIQPDSAKRSTERAAIYEEHEKRFTDEINDGLKTRNKDKLTATQNIGAGLFVGGCKVASGIEFMVPGFNHHYNTKGDRSNLVTNSNLFVASVIGVPASAFSMIDTLRIQVQGEINRSKQLRAGILPRQIVAARLQQLDTMEARLKAGR
jgi:hypothetical protein